MFKLGCVALVAIACSGVVSAAHAQGNFFVAGQYGQAKYDDSGFDDDSADTYGFSGGYRWQAGPIVQVGVEVGYGKVDEISEEFDDSFYYYPYTYTTHERLGLESSFTSIGGNARINFGEGSRWFAIARGGYMAYDLDVNYEYTAYENGRLYDSGRDSASDDGGGAYFGGGVGFDITPNFNLNLMFSGYAFEYDDGDDDIGTATTTTLGLEARF